jgi:glycosyltransferase involved in cell wall biosynthesis
MPRVSIGMPVYNGEKFVAEALDSILAQDFGDFELIISDNASTDKTQQICEAYARRDSRVKYSRLPENLGAAKNYNRVFELSSGEFFKWAPHDDLIDPRFLSACLAQFEKAPPETVLVYPKTRVIDGNGKSVAGIDDDPDRTVEMAFPARLWRMLGKRDASQSLLHRCFPALGLIRRSVLKRTSLIASMPRADRLLVVQLAAAGPFATVDEALSVKRRHDDCSIASAERQAQGTELERLIAHWYDPSRRNSFPATLTRLALGYLKAALGAPVGLLDRIKAVGVVSVWIWRKKRHIAGEVKVVVLEQFWRLAHPRRFGDSELRPE